MKLLPILAIAALTSCTASTFLHDGKPVCRIEGNFVGKMHVAPDGTVDIDGNLNHSETTKAQGDAVATKSQAIGAAIAVSGVAALLH